MSRLLFFLPYLLFAETTLLSQAETISQSYQEQISKTPPPGRESLANQALISSSNWLTIHLESLENQRNPIDSFDDPKIWQLFKDIGIQSVHLKNIKNNQELIIDPSWKSSWTSLQEKTQRQKISFVGDLMGNAIPMGSDFEMAIQNQKKYTSLFHLIEIDPKDWNLIPEIPSGQKEANVPWLNVQKLHQKGYIQELFNPYIKKSSWNTTAPIVGIDGKKRRWIYLKEGKNNPCLSWLSTSFGAYQLITANALGMFFELGEKILQIDGKIPLFAQEMIALWIRKMGAYTTLSTNGTLASIANAPTDFATDSATPIALLHALITQNTTALQMIYQLFLENNIPSHKLVHTLQPFETHLCDWMELIQSPQKKFNYGEEKITANFLRQRLLKEDLLRLQLLDRLPETTWVDYCKRSLNLQDFENHVDDIQKLHLLLAFTYAHQPGVFCVSLEDLLGAYRSKNTNLNILESNPDCIYASLPIQQTNPDSFTSQLSQIIRKRNETNIARGSLIDVLPSPNPGTLLLLHRLGSSGFIQLLAVNFSKESVQENIKYKEIAETSAIDIMTQLGEEKVFSSPQFSFNLDPQSARAFYFQPKYY